MASSVKEDIKFGRSLKKGPRTVFIGFNLDCGNAARLRRYKALLKMIKGW